MEKKTIPKTRLAAKKAERIATKKAARNDVM